MTSARLVLAAAGLLGCTTVGAGAFGAHALRSRLDARALEVWSTAVTYEGLHAAALLGLAAVMMGRSRVRVLFLAAGCLFGGTAVFGASLHGLALGGPRVLGAIAPIGGVLMILGWICVAAHAVLDRRTPSGHGDQGSPPLS